MPRLKVWLQLPVDYGKDIPRNVEILSGGGLDNEESVRLANSKAGRSTKQKHRTNENVEQYTKIYKKSKRV